AVKLVTQKRDIGYGMVPIARFSNDVQVTDTAASAYYNQHPVEFTAPEQVSIEYLELSLQQLAQQQQADDAQLQEFYQNNLSQYTQPEQWHVAHILIKLPPSANTEQLSAARAKAEEIAKRIQVGEDFATLAEKLSDDTVSGKKGGVLDWFGPGMVEPSIEK